MVRWAGAVLALLIAIGLFSRFSIDDTLTRDESIYAYGGQQLANGVPVYVSIFDPKTPLSSMLAGLAVAIARAFGAGEVHLIRAEFFACACLAVVGVYMLGLWLWESAAAAIVSAVTFASFKGFAVDAIGGPDAKTPGVLLAVVSMALVLRRRWFWGAFAGALAFLVWQPFGVCAVVAVLAAVLMRNHGESRRELWHALAGAAIPLAAVTIYFALAGAVPEFFEAAFRFAFTGVQRGHETLAQHFDRIANTVSGSYGGTRVLFWGGLLALLAVLVARLVHGRSDPRGLLKDPLVVIVAGSFVPLAAFSFADFQSYPDLYPALPYAALGVGGCVALAVRHAGSQSVRRAAAAVALAGAAVLVGVSWHWYSAKRSADGALIRQRADAAAVERMLRPGDTLYSLGNPAPLVLTGRRNPSRYIDLGSGIIPWIIHHTPGGFAGWEAKILAAHPRVVVIDTWHGPYERAMESRLSSIYTGRRVGAWRVFVTADRGPPRA